MLRRFWVLVVILAATTMMQGPTGAAFGEGVPSKPTLYGNGQSQPCLFIASLELVDGDLWVGCYDGLCRLDGDGELTPVNLPDTVECAIGSAEHAALRKIPPYQIHSMRRDPFSHYVWVGLNDERPCAHADYISIRRGLLKPGGLLCYDEARSSWRFYPPTEGQVSSRTYSIAFDSASVWVWGRYPLVSWETEGVYRHDRTTGAITFIPAELGHVGGILGVNCGLPTDLLTIFNDRLWFGQAQLIDQAGIWVSFDGVTGQANRDVTVVKSDGRLLWFGYNNGLITCYSPETGRWDIQELPRHIGAITCFAFTDGLVLAGVGYAEWHPEERRWHGSGELLVLDRQRGAWGYVNSLEGIPSISVNTLLLDGDTVWIGANRGLVKWSLAGLLSEVEWTASEPQTSAGQTAPCR